MKKQHYLSHPLYPWMFAHEIIKCGDLWRVLFSTPTKTLRQKNPFFQHYSGPVPTENAVRFVHVECVIDQVPHPRTPAVVHAIIVCPDKKTSFDLLVKPWKKPT